MGDNDAILSATVAAAILYGYCVVTLTRYVVNLTVPLLCAHWLQKSEKSEKFFVQTATSAVSAHSATG